MGTADLVLKAACERCGGASDLYGTGCRHTTLCCACAGVMARSRECCPVCAAPITELIREYNVKVDTTAGKALSIGRFTTGLPPFAAKENAGSSWSLRKEGPQLTGNKRDNYYNRKPWILEDETGEYQYQGQVEGLQSAASTYYLLMLRGKELRAVPVGSWHNFSKISQHRQLTLEEAEEQMNRRRNAASGYQQRMMKTATNGAAAFSSDVTKLDDGNEAQTGGVHLKKRNRNGSDKGNDDKREQSTKGNEDEEDGGKDRDFDFDDEIEKGDDWEHEEIFTDDDEAVDIDPEETADLADSEVPAPPEIKQYSQDDNENGQGGLGLSKSGKELKKLLHRAAGQTQSDDEEDTDEDESPSPVVAPKQKNQLKTEPGEDDHSKPTGPEDLHSPPGALKSNQKRREGGDAKTSNAATPKKPKIEPGTKTIAVKEETSPSLEPTSKPFASDGTDTNVSPVTEEEIRIVLNSFAPVSMQDFVARFKPRLSTREDKVKFGALVKKIAFLHLVNGKKCIALREEYK